MRVSESPKDYGEKSRHFYKMNEQFFSIGDDYWIENEQGKREYYVDGKAFRVRDIFILKDEQGSELYKIQEKLLKIRDTMDIKRADGKLAAIVKKAFINILGDTWNVEIPNGPDMKVHGDILDHEYRIDSEGKRIAEVSKKWFSFRDAYGVEIEPGQDDALILAITVSIDQMAHDDSR